MSCHLLVELVPISYFFLWIRRVVNNTRRLIIIKRKRILSPVVTKQLQWLSYDLLFSKKLQTLANRHVCLTESQNFVTFFYRIIFFGSWFPGWPWSLHRLAAYRFDWSTTRLTRANCSRWSSSSRTHARTVSMTFCTLRQSILGHWLASATRVN